MIDNAAAQGEQRFVWDWPVRLSHWALVVAFIGAYITHLLGIEYFKYHAYCGYAVIVLVLFRIVWGVVGTSHARFVNFVRGPIATLRYASTWLRHDHSYLGHNPLGAWMIVALLAALLTQGALGLFANDEILNYGPFSLYIDGDLSIRLTSVHRRLFYWIAAAVCVHVLAVLAHAAIKKEPLIGAMITGRKTLAPRNEKPPGTAPSYE